MRLALPSEIDRIGHWKNNFSVGYPTLLREVAYTFVYNGFIWCVFYKIGYSEN